jgi:hypothetical protein
MLNPTNGGLARQDKEYDMDRDEFAHRLEVRANIAREAQRERDLYERGIKAMAEASNKESQ